MSRVRCAEGALEVGAEDTVTMLNLIDDSGELAAVPAVQAGAEDRGNLVGGEPPQAEFASAQQTDDLGGDERGE